MISSEEIMVDIIVSFETAEKTITANTSH